MRIIMHVRAQISNYPAHVFYVFRTAPGPSVAIGKVSSSKSARSKSCQLISHALDSSHNLLADIDAARKDTDKGARRA
jgi:hypothetical protein